MQPFGTLPPHRFRTAAALLCTVALGSVGNADETSEPFRWTSVPVGVVVSDASAATPSRDEGRSEGADANAGMIVDSQIAAITLEELESIALASNPSIARAASLVNAARGRALQAGLGPNPEVGINLQQLGSDGLAEQYGVMIGQEYVRRPKLELNRAVVLHEVSRLTQQLAAQKQRVLTDVQIAYIRALRAERQIELTKLLVQLGELGVRVANELLTAQEVGRTDLLQAELEVESAEILLQNAQNRRLAVWRSLSSVVGQPLQPQPLQGDLADSDQELQFDQALERLRVNSPEIAAVLAEIQRARCNLSRQIVEPLPNVTVQGLINWRDNGAGGDANGGITVSLPIPIWNRNQGGIREARHRLAAAERKLGQTELLFQERLAPVFERYRNAFQQVDRYANRILPKAEETLELTREIYELGEISFINLLTVQRTYANNQLAFLNALEQWRVAEAEITGMLLSNSMSENLD